MIQYNVYFLDMDIAFFYSLKLFSYKADNCNTQQSFRIEHQPLKSVYSYVYIVLNQLILIQWWYIMTLKISMWLEFVLILYHHQNISQYNNLSINLYSMMWLLVLMNWFSTSLKPQVRWDHTDREGMEQ